ncbi:hypothetical protein NL676_039867 [Syzygium grande]|nr:hypothetical protein NL676_039867 [Syzygium grande]
MLQIPKCVKFVSTVNRPNLFYMVLEKSSVARLVIDEIAEFIWVSYLNNESGIVCCFSRKECEQVAKELRDRGISPDYYHADMDVNACEKVHLRKWRAGRDILPSECLLYYRAADSLMVFYENSGLQDLYDIVRYYQSKRQCCRSAFFGHFAEAVQDCNGMCDRLCLI